MTEILAKFPDILSYGIPGLITLLFFFAFILLYKESQKKASNTSVLQVIKLFMIFSAVLAIVLVVSNIIQEKNKNSKIEPKCWEISAEIELQDNNGNIIKDENLLKAVSPSLTPPYYRGPQEGSKYFYTKLPEYKESYVIRFSLEGFDTEEKKLSEDEESINIDKKARKIDIGTIILRPKQ